jgi:hypothetical protein
MGSWANSLHVKGDSTQAVVAAIRAILGRDGFKVTFDEPRRKFARTAAEAGGDETAGGTTFRPFPSDDDDGHGASSQSWHEDDELDDDEPDDDDFDDDFDAADDEFDEPPGADVSDRRLIVTEPRDGWIGVLDNDFGGLHALAGKLSAQLHTDTLAVCVNDSDAWYYVLYRDGREYDQYDSSGGECDDDAGDVPREVQAAMERGDEEEVERLLEKELWSHAPKGPINMPDGAQLMPPELVSLMQKVHSGKATWWQRVRYRWLWVKFIFKLITGRYQPHGEKFGFEIPRLAALDTDSLDQHLARLREVFPRLDEPQVRRLLPVSRFPAENLLADFLGFIRLPKLYAYLSYDYLDDFGTSELRADGIRLAHELRFER